MKKVIDARKLDCPKPVLLTKKAIENEEVTQLEILVDNLAARNNVSAFLKKKQIEIDKISETDNHFTIYTKKIAGRKTVTEEIKTDVAGKTIFIASDAIGTGSDELGGKLMKAFLYSLNEFDLPPRCLLFMNAGVKLCLKNAESLKNLVLLQEKGVEILVCGTCLDYYNLTSELAVGKISNMYDIAGHLLEDTNVIKI